MNKKIILRIFLTPACLLFLASHPYSAYSEEPAKKTSIFTLHEKGAEVQFLTAQLSDENNHLHMESIFLTYGFKMNSLLNLDNHKGTIQMILAPFFSTITSPTASVAFGLNIAYRYTYPLSEKISVFGEFGAAPMYFGLNTVEQGKSGFNFLDQGAVGFQYFFSKDQAIGIGYRKVHISNLSIRDENDGINGDAGFISFSKFF